MGKNIRLTRIRVTNLFGRFTYDIDLDNGQPAGILIAPNGCGKTTIFNLVNFIFNPSEDSYKDIASVPFNTCTCTLSNGKSVTLNKRIIQDEGPLDDEGPIPVYARRRLRSRSMDRDQGRVNIILNIEDNDPINITRERIRILNYLGHRDQEAQYLSDEDYALLDVDEADLMEVPSRSRTHYRQLVIMWIRIRDTLKTKGCSLSVNFIRADRLYGQRERERDRDRQFYTRRDREREDKSPLDRIQDRMRALYGEILDQYNNLQREIKDKLPQMYLDNVSSLQWEEFEQEWNAYQEDIRKYSEIGLLASGKAILEPDELRTAYKEKGEFLTVYLLAFKETLLPLKEYYDQLKLFVDILNHRNRVTHKVFSFSKAGIVVTVDGRDLELDRLSSGEKNDVVMFYNLIFGSENNGLVLVDEPEISLHIEWQQEYLDRLLEICNMNELQAIVATHSPYIVNGHTDLYVRKGLRNENEG